MNDPLSSIYLYKIRIEFKPQDLWIGIYWKWPHVWICIIPMLPIHLWFQSDALWKSLDEGLSPKKESKGLGLGLR